MPSVPNFENLLKEAQKVQERFQESQQKIIALVITGKSGGDMVAIDMNGKHEAKKCKINPTVLDDVEMLQDLVVAAINDAVHKIEKALAKEMSTLTAGLNIPTDFMGKENKNDE